MQSPVSLRRGLQLTQKNRKQYDPGGRERTKGPTSLDMLQPPEAGRDKEPSPCQTSKGSVVLDFGPVKLISDYFLTSIQNGENKFQVLLSH